MYNVKKKRFKVKKKARLVKGINNGSILKKKTLELLDNYNKNF